MLSPISSKTLGYAGGAILGGAGAVALGLGVASLFVLTPGLVISVPVIVVGAGLLAAGGAAWVITAAKTHHVFMNLGLSDEDAAEVAILRSLETCTKESKPSQLPPSWVYNQEENVSWNINKYLEQVNEESGLTYILDNKDYLLGQIKFSYVDVRPTPEELSSAFDNWIWVHTGT